MEHSLLMIYRCCADRDNKTPDGIFPVHPSPLPEQSPIPGASSALSSQRFSSVSISILRLRAVFSSSESIFSISAFYISTKSNTSQKSMHSFTFFSLYGISSAFSAYRLFLFTACSSLSVNSTYQIFQLTACSSLQTVPLTEKIMLTERPSLSAVFFIHFLIFRVRKRRRKSFALHLPNHYT